MRNKYSNKQNQVKNPHWWEADQLAIYKCSREVELGGTENNISQWSDPDFNPELMDFKSGAKQCQSFEDITGKLIPFFAIPPLWPWKRPILQTLKIHRKLMKIAIMIIFHGGDHKNIEIYISEKTLEGLVVP